MILPVVELCEVTKVFRGSPPVTALQKTSLTIGRGDRVAIVGPSGSGKSTLLSLLGTLSTPTSGEVVIDGHQTSKMRGWQKAALRGTHLSFIFQQFHLLPGLTAEENVATGLLYAGVRSRERMRLSREALQRVGLGRRFKHRPGELSGGEQQRVAIARALVRNPSILFADEPTGALDSQAGLAVLDLLLEASGLGTGIVVVTHDLNVAAHFDRKLFVLDGFVSENKNKHALS